MKPRCVLSLLYFLVFLTLLYTTACSKHNHTLGGETLSPNETTADIETHADPAWPALALIKPGVNPLWFELGPGGPQHIESPAAARLTHYVPWPHAWFVGGMQIWENFIVIAVNRDGFLILGAGAEPAELVLYRAADSAHWEPYTTESFFFWEDKPAVLLYRNDFFSELSVPPPASQVYILSKTSSVPLAVNIPAFKSIPPPWEVEVVRQGADSFWYFRAREKGQPQNYSDYFRTEDLTNAGTRISIEEWRVSDPRGAEPGGANVDTNSFSLPALPEGFAYSGIAVLGNNLVASWEEQQDASIGAAGFMIMAIDVLTQ